MVLSNNHLRRPYMQFIALPKTFYKLYEYARTQECLDAYRSLYENAVNVYQLLKDEGCNPRACYAFSGISRATFYEIQKNFK